MRTVSASAALKAVMAKDAARRVQGAERKKTAAPGGNAVPGKEKEVPRDAVAQGKRKEASGGKVAVAKRSCPGLSVSSPAPGPTIVAGPPVDFAPVTMPVAPPVRIPGAQLKEKARSSSPGGKGKHSVAPASSGSRPSSGRSAPRPGREPGSAPVPSGSSAGCSSPQGGPGGISVSRHQEGETQVLQLRVGPRDSALRNGTVARGLINMTLLPGDLEVRGRMSVGDVMDGIFPHLVELIHDATTLRAAVTRYADMNTSLQSKLKEVEEQLAGSDRRVKGMADREARSKEEQAKTKVELIKLQEENAKLQEENAKLQKINGELQKENQDTRAALATRDSRLLELQGLAADRLARLERNQKLLEAANDKVKAAEDRVSTVEGRALVLEEELAQAVAAAVRAVDEYKDSDEFENDAATACVNLFEYGYSNCLAKVKAAYPDLDLSQLAFDTGNGEDGEDHAEDIRELPDAGREEQGGADKEDHSADGARASDELGKDEVPKDKEPKKERDPKNGESGTNISEPIVVESPEPEHGQE